jgi:hypothetical protein
VCTRNESEKGTHGLHERLVLMITFNWNAYTCTFFFQYFEGHGWFTGEVTAYDGEFYLVVYDDGDSEEYDDRSMEDLLLTPELEDIKVGSRLAISKLNNNTCYKATVTRVKPGRNKSKPKPFYLEYDDGDCGWLVLGRHTFRMLSEELICHSEDHETEVEANSRDVIMVQSLMRRRAAKNFAQQRRRERIGQSATAIQAAWRGYWTREGYYLNVQDVIFVQKIVRGRAARNVARQKWRELRIFQAATAIQTAWTRYHAHTSYTHRCVKVIILQSMLRCRAARIVAKQRRCELRDGSAQDIQTAWRRYCAHTSYQAARLEGHESRHKPQREIIGNMMQSKAAHPEAVENEKELLQDLADVSWSHSPSYSVGTKVKKVRLAPRTDDDILECFHLHLFAFSTSRVMAGSLAKSQLTMESSTVSSTRTGTMKNMMIETWRILY